MIIRFEDGLNAESFERSLPLFRPGAAVADEVEVETTRVSVTTVLLVVLPSLTVTSVDVSLWLLLIVVLVSTTREESDRVDITSRDVTLSLEGIDADVLGVRVDVVCDGGFEGEVTGDETRVSDDGVPGRAEESEAMTSADEDAVDEAADGAAFVETAVELPVGGPDVG